MINELNSFFQFCTHLHEKKVDEIFFIPVIIIFVFLVTELPTVPPNWPIKAVASVF